MSLSGIVTPQLCSPRGRIASNRSSNRTVHRTILTRVRCASFAPESSQQQSAPYPLSAEGDHRGPGHAKHTGGPSGQAYEPSLHERTTIIDTDGDASPG